MVVLVRVVVAVVGRVVGVIVVMAAEASCGVGRQAYD